MLVISDTSVVSNLALIRRLKLLFQVFDDVVIPVRVFSELRRLTGAHALKLIDEAVESGSLKVEELTTAECQLADQLVSELDRGEAEAIALAELRHADVLCIDEVRGRRVAIEHGLRIKGLLGILDDAKAAGFLNAITPCLDELEAEANFFMSKGLKREILRLAGE
ncbi:MAG: DUF3368 domain-containing protein [Prosthecobacter sp.]|jgi:predicted nucleic acid-binding protein|uniref:DUF3368 domain-containing protein n=1 Tax=Prosthecobacter sp. TaxID=1965333 RepID=UPI001A0A59CC|nr:DUF3368 domain-containing protein [Prosthecobacter sp.]MBE2283173.1 DUF3368 domain-containing protein [Prosthecobacter sp.]